MYKIRIKETAETFYFDTLQEMLDYIKDCTHCCEYVLVGDYGCIYGMSKKELTSPSHYRTIEEYLSGNGVFCKTILVK